MRSGSRCVAAAAAVLLAVATAGWPADAHGDGDARKAVPQAADVILRGRTDLADALRAAIRVGGATPASVAFVVDSTPYVAASEDGLVDAEMRAAADLPDVSSWRAAGLGERMPPAAGSSGGAALRIADALRRPTDTPNTMTALRTTLDGFADRGGVVVHLADWHFEDDDGTEGLAAHLRGRGQTLSVVGSEAAFSRAWNDVLELLDRAVAGAQRSLDDADRRLLADVHLIRHVVRAQRHAMAEALTEAKHVPDAWFDDRTVWVGMRPVAWVQEGGDPEAIRADYDLERDPARARAAVEDRAMMLRRYSATPWGESVARNRMYVWRAGQFPFGTADAGASRSPAESAPPPTPSTPGGSPGAPGPATGR